MENKIEPLKGFTSDNFIIDGMFNKIEVNDVDNLTDLLTCRIDVNNNPILLESKNCNEFLIRSWTKLVKLHLNIKDIKTPRVQKFIKPYIICAMHQDFWVTNKNNFIRANNIQLGDELLTFSFDTSLTVSKIELLKNENKNNIYELKNITDNNNYFVNGVLTR